MYNNIYGFIDKELSELDHRIVINGKLNMQEAQYVDLLAHLEKSLLTSDAMKKSDKDLWSKNCDSKNDNTVRYSEGSEESYQYSSSMISELHKLMETAPNEYTKHKMEEFISEMERMS